MGSATPATTSAPAPEGQSFDHIFTAEAARILDVSPETVRWWERIGRLPAALKAGRGVRLFDRGAVQRLADARKAQNSTTRGAPRG